MSSNLVLDGVENLAGKQLGTLTVERYLGRGRNHEPQYAVRCNCGCAFNATHSRLRNGAARCTSSACGKTTQPRSLAAEQHREPSQIESARDAALREASNRRMAALTEGYERPTRYTPSPSEPDNLTDRQRRALRERREAEDAEQREAERPAREAAERAAAEQSARGQREQEQRERQRAYWRDAVLNGADPKFYVSPELVSVSLPKAEAESNNLQTVQQFIAETPEYAHDYKTPENAGHLVDYLTRNGCMIFDVPTLQAAFSRLLGLGILARKAAPVPMEEKPAPVQVNLRTSKPKPVATNPKDEIVDGWELDGSAPRKWSQRELDRLSSTDYRRVLRLYSADLSLKPLSPLFRGSDEA